MSTESDDETSNDEEGSDEEERRLTAEILLRFNHHVRERLENPRLTQTVRDEATICNHKAAQHILSLIQLEYASGSGSGWSAHMQVSIELRKLKASKSNTLPEV